MHQYLVRGAVVVACKTSHSHGMWCCSRCTGYRPILDAFKVFAKADPAAYTEESIAASQGLQPNGHEPDGPSANGHPNGVPNGVANGANGNAAVTDGHANGGSTDSSHAANGHANNGHAENGHCSGQDASSSKGTVKELTAASKSNGHKVPPPPNCHPILPLLHLIAVKGQSCATSMHSAARVASSLGCIFAAVSSLLDGTPWCNKQSLPNSADCESLMSACLR